MSEEEISNFVCLSEDDKAGDGETAGCCDSSILEFKRRDLMGSREESIWIEGRRSASHRGIELSDPEDRKNKSYLWPTGEITVSFKNGSSSLRAEVLKVIEKWARDTGINFVHVESRGDVRVSFEGKAETGWCQVGTRSIKMGRKSRDTTSMKLGVYEGMREKARRRVILHEFGHALGFKHEHQHPGRDLKFDDEIVIAYYKKNEGWDETRVRRQILDKYRHDQIIDGSYDRSSIMMYPFLKDWIKGGGKIKNIYDLSENDKGAVAFFYPASLRAYHKY